MGAVGTTSNGLNISVEENTYYGYEPYKEDMNKAIDNVKNSLNAIMQDSWMDKDDEHIYEALADYYPRSMSDNDAEKVILVDMDKERITTVSIYLHDYGNGRIDANLKSYNYSFNEFSDDELYDMGIEREKK